MTARTTGIQQPTRAPDDLVGNSEPGAAISCADTKGETQMMNAFSTTDRGTAVLLLGLGHPARIEDGRFRFPSEARHDVGRVKWMLSELRKKRRDGGSTR